MPSASTATVSLSLVSHTNVGKTTLARTLLRKDIGEIRDEAHVTEAAEGHVLIDTPQGDALRLWDTPGFGDSVRLGKRLRMSDNPIGWLLTQVWDRLTDRPFYSSQQAVRNVKDESDVILYLVNAAEAPASAGYVEAEMQILGWIGKPVVLLLNQMGPPRGREADSADEAAWRQHLAPYPWVRGAISLDAFARCWVQEDGLLGAVGAVLPAEKQGVFGRLRDAWRSRNLRTFEASMQAIAGQVAAAATDREPVDPPGLDDRVGRWVASVVRGAAKPDPATERAMTALASRLDRSVRETTYRLIALHGLSGRAAEEILTRVAGQFDTGKRADVAKTGLIGGLVSGALGGLAADLAAGGLSFGAGALIGAILGAIGVGTAAQAYNVAIGAEQGTVGWSAPFLTQRVSAALLRYLAVAHFGRGRGDWVESEYPPHWHALVDEVVAEQAPALGWVWTQAEQAEGREEIERALHPIVTDATRRVLTRLYPEAAPLFTPTRPEIAPHQPDAGATTSESSRPRERRIETHVIGPGAPGYLKVQIGSRVRDVPAERLPPALRLPNSRFVGVVRAGELLRVEPAGPAWIEVQNRVRAVLNADWDPIGLAETAGDEYDGYIAGIYAMLRRDASPTELAEHLRRIEEESMGLGGLPPERRLEAARRLRALDLPAL
jgi:hypothetical protein